MTRRCRNAVYWAAPDRTYALSRKETPTEAKCPKCGNPLSLEPFTRSEKIYICSNGECKWKIQKSKVVTRVNVKIGSEESEITARIAGQIIEDSIVSSVLSTKFLTWEDLKVGANRNPVVKNLVDIATNLHLEKEIEKSLKDGKIENYIKQPWLHELSDPFRQVYEMAQKGKIRTAGMIELREYGSSELMKNLDPDDPKDQKKCKLIALVSQREWEEMKRGGDLIPELKGMIAKPSIDNKFGVEFHPKSSKSYTIFPMEAW